MLFIGLKTGEKLFYYVKVLPVLAEILQLVFQTVFAHVRTEKLRRSTIVKF